MARRAVGIDVAGELAASGWPRHPANAPPVGVAGAEHAGGGVA